jgi:hypothetical protein
VSRLRPWAAERYFLGRWLAGTRASWWPVTRRLAYAAAAPLITVVRLRRILDTTRRTTGEQRLLPRVLPALVLGVGIATAGELIGFLFGAGDAGKRVIAYDIRKLDCVTEADRAGVL